MKYITTSWDDGHVLDFRLAGLLEKYNLPGTFYIPKANAERKVMSEREIRELSTTFEIGGHTLSHARLHRAAAPLLHHEVGGSFLWLQNLLGADPVSFCFPGGAYTTAALAAVFECGYKIARSTELLSVTHRLHSGVMPTTVQVFEHSNFTYIKHLLKRKRVFNLLRFLQAPLTKNSIELARYFLLNMKNGECFHLWGHSWEIEEMGLWVRLEEFLKLLSNIPGFTYVQNRGLSAVRA